VAQPIYTLHLADNENATLSEITGVASEKRGAYRLNRPAIWSFQVPCDNALVNTVRPLFQRLWQTEAWLRAKPRELLYITPVAGVVAPTNGNGPSLSRWPSSIDPAALSPRALATLRQIATRLSEGFTLYETARELGIRPSYAERLLDDLRDELARAR